METAKKIRPRSLLLSIALAFFGMTCVLLCTEPLAEEDVNLDARFSASVKQALTSIGYTDAIADDLLRIVSEWKTSDGRNQVGLWLRQISASSSEEADNAKFGVCESLAYKISHDFTSGDPYDLGEVLQAKQAQCMGYSQLFWVLANALGIQTSIVEVERYSDLQRIPGVGHVCCISSLSADKFVMVDIAYGPMAGERLVSVPFKIKDHYTAEGGYLKLRTESNPLMIHREVKLLDTNGLIASLYCNRAYEANAKKNYEQAITYYEKAEAISPLDAGQYNNMAITLHSLGRNTEALDAINKSISMRPEYAPAHHNLANVLRHMNREHEAIAEYKKAVSLDEKLWEAWMNLGVCYYVSGADRKAVTCLEKAHQLQPDDVQTLLHLGVAYGLVGEAEKAESSLREAISLDPKSIDKARSIQAFLEKQGVKVKLED